MNTHKKIKLQIKLQYFFQLENKEEKVENKIVAVA